MQTNRRGSSVASPTEVVERYFDGWTSGNFDAARALLRDDVSFAACLR